MPPFDPPLPPLLFPSHSLRLATFNIGLGFTRKLPSIIDRGLSLSLDVIALQETGDPAVTRQRHPQYSFIASPGPSGHQAGVGLLISNELTPRCRAYKRSSSGRLVGVILELSKGHQLLIISAYMPSGLDAHEPSAVEAANKLYDELMSWTVGVKQVVVMGDLNETLTQYDRLSLGRASRPALAPIQRLVQGGFTDTYRLLHPDAATEPGYTHFIDSLTRPSRSRIDYIWTRSTTPASHLRMHIDSAKQLRLISHHRLLWMELEIPNATAPSADLNLFQLRIPNLRAASLEQQQSFIDSFEEQLHRDQHQLTAMAMTASRDSLTALATALAGAAHRASFSNLPLTGAAPFKSTRVLRLQRQHRDLIRLRLCTQTLLVQDIDPTHSPEWTRLYVRCLHEYQLTWIAHESHNINAWLEETKHHISVTRQLIAAEKNRLTKERAPPLDANPAAQIHRMLASDALPSQIYSVINDRNELTSSPLELEDVMVNHFESVFSIPLRDPVPLRPPPPAMLFHKDGIHARWYDALMEAVDENQLLRIVSDSPLVSAPGQDEVSTGVWKLAIQGSSVLRTHITALFTACLQTSIFPSAWKTSVIIPLVKDAAKDRTMSNIRPISLQSCLGKLLSKILARRLGAIFQQHPILNPAQRGFVLGGTTMKCIDELLDAWDWSRKGGRELYTIFYDIKQAYDSVEVLVLERAMTRLQLPPLFIRLIVDSLTGLSSCIRTTYGHTRCFPVRRSVRQGDPLAPLLFIILMDALHDGLELNPLTGERHGCKLVYPTATVELPSLGYADDTNILANTLHDLFIQNEWVEYFMRFNRMRLNPLKCELIGRNADGAPVTPAALDAHNITIGGVAVQPVPHDQPIRYLGVHSCFNGSWMEQQKKALAMIGKFTCLAKKFHLSIHDTVYLFNVFLISRLELALHYVHGQGTSGWIKKCDRLMVGCIKHLVSSPLQLSHTAVASTLHFVLPSRLEISIKVSELFLRLNSADTRWGRLGRAVMRLDLPSTVDHTTSLPQPNSGTRNTRAAYLVVKKLHWSLHFCEARNDVDRRRHLFHTEVIDDVPSRQRSQCTVRSHIELGEGHAQVAHDCWVGWGTDQQLVDNPVHAYTDGSYDSWNSSSAWSVVLKDRWLVDNFRTVPSERLLQLPHVGGATLVGASISCSDGVYPAELQAIARTLAMLPLNFKLHIHSDSEASIAAIGSHRLELNERTRMRMAGRTILQLIDHLMTRRLQAGGDTQFSHIRAHTDSDDIDSIGNRIADFQAQRSRTNPLLTSTPPWLNQLPLHECEPHLHIKSPDGRVVIDDIRRASRSVVRAQDLTYWSDHYRNEHQGKLACEGTLELGKVVLKSGSRDQQVTLVHTATNTIHYHWWPPDGPDATLEQVQCTECKVALSLDHLAICNTPLSTRYRDKLCDSLLDVISNSADTRTWLRANRGVDLDRLYSALFPPSVTSTVDEVILHPSRCLIGAYTRQECTRAIKSLGIHDRTEGQDLLTQLRLTSLDHIDRLYTQLKAASP